MLRFLRVIFEIKSAELLIRIGVAKLELRTTATLRSASVDSTVRVGTTELREPALRGVEPQSYRG